MSLLFYLRSSNQIQQWDAGDGDTGKKYKHKKHVTREEFFDNKKTRKDKRKEEEDLLLLLGEFDA